MKKVIYLASVLFLLSCGSEEKPVKEEVSIVEVAEPVIEDEVVVVEEIVVEETADTFVGDATLGETLFKDKGCVACHKASEKLIGPSLVTISEGYGDKGDNIVSFLKEESDPIIDPEQYEIMKANFGVTKEMTDNDLKALVAFILKH